MSRYAPEGDRMTLPLSPPDPFPRGWILRERRLDGFLADNHASQLRVILSRAVESDGRRWTHLSVSHRTGRVPTWPELVSVRDTWLGDVECYQVLPTRDRWVNIANVLHLFAPDEPVLPEFEGTHPDVEGLTL